MVPASFIDTAYFAFAVPLILQAGLLQFDHTQQLRLLLMPITIYLSITAPFRYYFEPRELSVGKKCGLPNT